MKLQEKLNLINENPNLAFSKLINSSAENHIFLDFEKKHSKSVIVYTTEQGMRVTRLALEEMAKKGLI